MALADGERHDEQGARMNRRHDEGPPEKVWAPITLAGDGAQKFAADTNNPTLDAGADQSVLTSALRAVSRGGVPFATIVRDSTPATLLTMVDLHRRYAQNEALPAELQRAIGRCWMRGAR